MGISAAQLAAMQETVSSTLPDSATIERTGQVVRCWVAREAEAPYPGGPGLVPLRRWHIQMAAAADVTRRDLLSIDGKGVYIVVNSMHPRSNPTSVDALAFQLRDPLGNLSNPVFDNALVQNRRRGTEQGDPRRVRIEFRPPGGVGPGGLAVPDLLWDNPPDNTFWELNDVVEILSIDDYDDPPHPRTYRVTLVSPINDVIPVCRAELAGLGGADQVEEP